MHTNDMFKQLNLLKLSDIFDYFILKFIHSCFYGHDNIVSEKLIVNPFHNHKQSRNQKFNYSIVILDLEKHMTLYNFLRIFNSLSNELLMPQSSARLKRENKKYAIT